MIRAAYEEYRRELLEAPPILQLMFCWTLGAWGLLLLHAHALERLAGQVTA